MESDTLGSMGVSAHVDQHGLQGIVTVSYKTYHDTYRNTYQISRYISLVEKVYRYTPSIYNRHFFSTNKFENVVLVKSPLQLS
jgi:hypothetical protein